MKYRTCVGIDTYSTKNEVFALDAGTGEAWRATLSDDLNFPPVSLTGGK